MSIYSDNLKESILLQSNLLDLDEVVCASASAIVKTMKNGFRLYLCGNGGSAADCQHLAAEFTGRFVKDRKALPAIALTTDSSALTCIANDYSFDEVFSRQLSGLGIPGDCLLAISTSGNSKNIIECVKVAKSLGVLTIGLLGRDGGLLKDICDISIVVPSHVTARIQEAHILIGHSICGAVESELGLV